jgi:hydroxymethylglutaryl-CoA reductase (NADPH)
LKSALDLALLTLSFPKDSKFSVSLPANSSAIVLPSGNKSSVVYAVPRSEINSFVDSVAVLPVAEGNPDAAGRQWVQVRLGGARRSWEEQLHGSIDGFWELIKVPCGFIKIPQAYTNSSSRMQNRSIL